MAKRKRKTPHNTTPPKQAPMIINDIRVQSADRSRKDIKSFKMALIGAESITLPNRTRLYDLYEDITIDGHLTGVIGKRIDAVLNKNIYFENKDKTHNEAFDDLIESEVFRDIIRKLLESQLWGLSGMEFIPGEKLKFAEIPRKHIKPHKKIISIMQTGEEGISYDGVSNLWVVGKEKDLGLLLKCAPYAIWKRGAMADYSQFIEIFGQPVRIVKYDAYDEKTQSEVKKVLDESGSSLALMIPKQAEFEMMDGKSQNSTGELQDRFRRACNEEMSIVILGNTETTNSSTSSGYAQSKEHGQQQLEITKNDCMFVRSMLNSEHFLTILQSYGFPVEGGTFVFEKEINLEELKIRIEIDEKVANRAPVGDDHWYNTYGIAKPTNYAELKAKMEAQSQATSEEAEEAETPGQKKRKKPKAKKETEIKLSAIQKLQKALADFFAPAHS